MPLKFWRRIITPTAAVKIFVIDGVVKVVSVMAKERSALVCKSDGVEYVVAQLQPNFPVQIRLLLFPDENSVELMCRGADIEVTGCMEGYAKISPAKTSDATHAENDSEEMDAVESEKSDAEIAEPTKAETLVAEAKTQEKKADAEPSKADKQVTEAQKQKNMADVESRKTETSVAETKKQEIKADVEPTKADKHVAETTKQEKKVDVEFRKTGTLATKAKNELKKADAEQKKSETPVAEAKKSEVKAGQPGNPEASKKRPAEGVKPQEQAKKARTEDNKKAEEKTVSRRVVGAGVQVEVVQVGRGQMAKPGRNVTVHYDGRLASNGKRFDKGKINFRLGMGEVIRGWDEGVKGMLVGEKRKLLIPAPAAYGARGAPPAIPPHAALMFDVELLKVA